VLAAVSPIFVVAARTSGGQSLGAALAILLVALTLRCVERPTTRRVAVIAALALFGLGTDALYLGLIVPFAGWLVARGAWAQDAAVLGAWSRVRRWRIWLPSAAPLCLAALLLTVSRFGFGFELPQSPPWHYLFDVLVGYELPLLLLGTAGCWLALSGRLWQRVPIAGLLVVWLAIGVLLDLLMQARQPSTLLLSALPLALLGGLALNHLVRSFVEGTPELVDALFAVGLLAALAFCLISANLSMQLALLGDVGRAGAISRAGVDGAGTAVLTCAVLCVAALVFNLHGAGSVAFGTGDEYLTGQRTTREGVALARLLVKNGGGVSTVTDDALLPLAWYLRDTVRSGGNAEIARLVPAGTKPPAGFAVSGNPAVVSVRWAPRSWSAHGMVRWWVFREAWGPHDDVSVQLVVAQ
jgi:hypothetical protein